MNAEPIKAMAIDGQASVPADCRGYYFDLAPVLAHCDLLRRHPDRAMVMCQHQVKLIAPGEVMLPRDQGFFLVILNHTGPAADALANEVNLALLALFFGTDALDGIAALFHPVTHGQLLEAGVSAALPPSAAAKPVAADPAMRIWQGADLKSGILPMHNLQREGASIYMCGPVGKRAGRTAFGSAIFKDCDPKDRPALDAAMLEHGLGFARQIVPTKFVAAICCGVGFETLAWSRGRQTYLQALRKADVAANPLVIIRIEDVPPGTTSGRLAEMVGALRPLARRVFVQMPDCGVSLMTSGNIGAAGLCATLPDKASAPEIVRIATKLQRAGLVQQAVTCVDNMADDQAMTLLRSAGIRFAAARPDDSSIKLGGFALEGELSSAYAA